MSVSSFVYLASAASVICSLAAMLNPDEKYEKYVSFACVLAFLLTVTVPVINVIKMLPEEIKLQSDVIKSSDGEYALTGEKLAEKSAEKAIEENIFMLLKEKTGISAFSVSSELSYSEKGIPVSAKITVSCQSKAAKSVFELKKAMLEKYLSGILICEVIITLE